MTTENAKLHLDDWLENFLAVREQNNPQVITAALALANLAGSEQLTPLMQTCLANGQNLAEILNDLLVDSETIAAGILFSCVRYADLNIDDVTEHVGAKIAKLIQGAMQMESIGELYKLSSGRESFQHNLDNIRKMLLAMAGDIRVVIIKLVERLHHLRHVAQFSENERRKFADETMAIYAPLANRLGIAKLKWELEDLGFKYLEPEKYNEILGALNKKFPERDHYIQNFITEIKKILADSHLKNVQITGRVKHIYSIYKKMRRKNVGLEGIFDVSAVRIFVDSVTDCYTALSQVHAAWKYLPDEFDDYIASPKPNGYRSVHTAVFGPGNKIVEIQIRTAEMHQTAELGVAAHWVYKEGKQSADYAAKIAWLRQVMDWQKEVVKTDTAVEAVRELFSDRIYVFTPLGDILDLQQGATPLDFAYAVHTELGHHCVGAKVNDNMVSLKFKLNTADRVEILTAKDAHPSRDWLSPTLGYLKTPRAKAKVFAWFKKLLPEKPSTPVAQQIQAPKIEPAKPNIITKPSRVGSTSDIEIHGLKQVLTRMASCCKPLPGEPIVGYITLGHGVSIHRFDCANILHTKKFRPEKLIQVSWSDSVSKQYPVDLEVVAHDRTGLVRDITNVVADAGITVVGLQLAIDKKENLAKIAFTIEISSVAKLTNLLAKLNQVGSVISAMRLK
ncbi:MAG: bifunctional (p)ppGpp synthetase/guanosine-3',5'-bis(diphosphate) 3'-pyrophosphohydrolase [Gammaproteobacteria bacterium]|nr:bifunctional (p)ppGpp synthetase/guanosine-3',5'-bis(diphosphate) 3'-pyrophosphohydrolase [Gammaproteobacteria bacterium]